MPPDTHQGDAPQNAHHLNADFAKPAFADTAAMDWQASPSASVFRKRLDLAGPVEAGRVTSVVRYEPDSTFPSHEHPDGEEILVLDGVFSDEHGDYPAGHYLLNPEGFSHAPRSAGGCVLFVKLRQYRGTPPDSARRQIHRDTSLMDWAACATGVCQKVLYKETGHAEVMRLLKLEPGAGYGLENHGGAEVFVVSGAAAAQGHGALKMGAWLRLPASEPLALTSDDGARLYLKTGHLYDHCRH